MGFKRKLFSCVICVAAVLLYFHRCGCCFVCLELRRWTDSIVRLRRRPSYGWASFATHLLLGREVAAKVCAQQVKVAAFVRALRVAASATQRFRRQISSSDFVIGSGVLVPANSRGRAGASSVGELTPSV
eukprot:323794-Prorocentrum_minimum.AAC.1